LRFPEDAGIYSVIQQLTLKMGLLPPSSGWIKMKAEGSSETLVRIYQTTHYSIPEECDWDIHDH